MICIYRADTAPRRAAEEPSTMSATTTSCRMVVVAHMEGWTPFSGDVLLYGHLQEKETQDPRYTYS